MFTNFLSSPFNIQNNCFYIFKKIITDYIEHTKELLLKSNEEELGQILKKYAGKMPASLVSRFKRTKSKKEAVKEYKKGEHYFNHYTLQVIYLIQTEARKYPFICLFI